MSPVRHKKYKHRKANELPIELLNRIIYISGVKNGLLLDPFAGTGTSLLSASKAGMKFIGSDISNESIPIIKKRLHDFRGIK